MKKSKRKHSDMIATMREQEVFSDARKKLRADHDQPMNTPQNTNEPAEGWWPATSSSSVIAEVIAEINRATTKFPTWPTDALHAVGVVSEEMGELQKEVMQLTYEPHKSSKEWVRKEAIQTASMAIRFLMSLDRYEFAPGSQHSQNS